MPEPEITRFKQTKKYEGAGTLAQIEEDLAHIRGLDQQSESWAWVKWMIPLPIPVMFFVAVGSNTPQLIISGPVLMIALWIVVWMKRRYDVENRRYELANGMVRMLKLDPQSPLRMGLVLTPIEVGHKVAGRNGCWTYYRDPWLYLEGRLADGVAFHFARTGYYDSYFHSVTSGRVTRTTTKKSWHFEDVVTLTFDPSRFPDPARLGVQAVDKLGLPKAIEVRHFDSSPGRLMLAIHGGFKWDATPGGDVRGALDAVPFTGLLFNSLYNILGTPIPADLAAAKALPPPRAITPKAPLTPREYAIVGVSSVLALAGIAMLMSGNGLLDRSTRTDESADSFNHEAKAIIACRQKTPGSVQCSDASEVTRFQGLVKQYRADAEDDWTSGLILMIAGGVVAALGGAGFVVWRVKRPKWIAEAEAKSDAAGAALTGSEATPPPSAQPAPQQNPWQQAQQQQGYPQQQPQPGYPQPPAGWRPPGT